MAWRVPVCNAKERRHMERVTVKTPVISSGQETRYSVV